MEAPMTKRGETAPNCAVEAQKRRYVRHANGLLEEVALALSRADDAHKHTFAAQMRLLLDDYDNNRLDLPGEEI